MQTIASGRAAAAGQVAGRFRDLQGLRQTVGGVGLLLLFGFELTVSPNQSRLSIQAGLPSLFGLAVFVLGLGLVVVAVVGVTRWYDRSYGRAAPTRAQWWRGAMAGFVGLLAFLIAFQVEEGAHISLNLMLTVLSAWVAGYWLYIGRPMIHYLVFAAAGLALSGISVAGLPPATFVWHLREATLFFAIASIVGGLIDHRILARALTERSIGDPA